jgi:hypothetical protein
VDAVRDEVSGGASDESSDEVRSEADSRVRDAVRSVRRDVACDLVLHTRDAHSQNQPAATNRRLVGLMVARETRLLMVGRVKDCQGAVGACDACLPQGDPTAP